MKSISQKKPVQSIGAEDQLRYILSIHFHPELGSSYWLGRQARLGWSVPDRIRGMDDLWQLGPMPLDDLRLFPVKDFIPKAFHRQLPRFILGETAGTSGKPCATAFRDDEFQSAFIDPFLKVVGATGFPTGKQWLWVGPSGPHIIGKVVRELARQTDSLDPFSVDFDPRWAKRLGDGSFGRQRYLDHVTSQAMDILNREDVGVLFTTPPALNALVKTLSDRQRERIRGIHYGGMSLTPEMVNDFRSAFPEAVHLAGYGNTLFGVAMEVSDGHRLAMDYFHLGGRLHFDLVDLHWNWSTEVVQPPRLAQAGEQGRVLFHRLDETCLLPNVLERDQAQRVKPSCDGIALGVVTEGLRNPKPLVSMAGTLQAGIY